jgi:hypothetical protein
MKYRINLQNYVTKATESHDVNVEDIDKAFEKAREMRDKDEYMIILNVQTIEQ